MKCTYCGYEYPIGTGITYFSKFGKRFHFCSNKCRTSYLVLKRNPRNVVWTKTHKEFVGKV